MTRALTIAATPSALPEMPPELAQKCASFDGTDLVRGTVPAVVVEQAKRHLAALERHHAPAPEGVIEAWCRMLRGGCAIIDERDFSGRLFAIRVTCGELPAWVWTQETMKLTWRQCRFFPTAQELFDVLDGIAQKGLLGTSHVRMLAAARSYGIASDWRDGEKPADAFRRRNGASSLSQILGRGNAE